MRIATDEVVDTLYLTEVDSTQPVSGETRGRDGPCREDQRSLWTSLIRAMVFPNP